MTDREIVENDTRPAAEVCESCGVSGCTCCQKVAQRTAPVTISSECYWQISHRGHHAWYQRALMAGDFRPGLAPRAEFIVDATGRNADPATVPTCDTCGEIPVAEELEPVERLTGQRGFLDVYRLPEGHPQRRAWPRPTDPNACSYCNSPGPVDPVTGLCAQCTAYLSRRK